MSPPRAAMKITAVHTRFAHPGGRSPRTARRTQLGPGATCPSAACNVAPGRRTLQPSQQQPRLRSRQRRPADNGRLPRINTTPCADTGVGNCRSHRCRLVGGHAWNARGWIPTHGHPYGGTCHIDGEWSVVHRRAAGRHASGVSPPHALGLRFSLDRRRRRNRIVARLSLAAL